MVLENTVDISVWREWCNFKSSPTNNVARSGSARSLLAVTSSTARSTSCHLLASTERRQSQVLCHCKRKQCHNYTIVPYATPLSTIGVRSQAQAFDREPRPCSLSSLPFAKLKPHHISRAHREDSALHHTAPWSRMCRRFSQPQGRPPAADLLAFFDPAPPQESGLRSQALATRTAAHATSIPGGGGKFCGRTRRPLWLRDGLQRLFEESVIVFFFLSLSFQPKCNALALALSTPAWAAGMFIGLPVPVLSTLDDVRFAAHNGRRRGRTIASLRKHEEPEPETRQ